MIAAVVHSRTSCINFCARCQRHEKQKKCHLDADNALGGLGNVAGGLAARDSVLSPCVVRPQLKRMLHKLRERLRLAFLDEVDAFVKPRRSRCLRSRQDAVPVSLRRQKERDKETKKARKTNQTDTTELFVSAFGPLLWAKHAVVVAQICIRTLRMSTHGLPLANCLVHHTSGHKTKMKPPWGVSSTAGGLEIKIYVFNICIQEPQKRDIP